MTGIAYNDAAEVSHNFEEEAGAGGTTRPVHGLPSGVVSTFEGIETAVEALAALISGGKLLVGDAVAAGFLSTLAGIVTSGRAAVDLSTTVSNYLKRLDDSYTGSNALFVKLVAGTAIAGKVQIDGDVSLTSTLTGYLSALAGIVTSGRAAVNIDSTALGYLSTLAGAITSSRMAVDLSTTINGYLSTLAGAVTSSRMAVNVDSTTTGKLDTLHTDLNTTIHGDLNPPSGGPKIGEVGSIGSAADVQFGSQALTRGMYVKNTSLSGQTLWVATSATVSATNSWLLAPGESTPFIECTNATAVFLRASATGGAASYLGA